MPIKEMAKQLGKDLLVSKLSGGRKHRHHGRQDHLHEGHRYHGYGHYRHGKATVGQALHEALKLSKHKGNSFILGRMTIFFLLIYILFVTRMILKDLIVNLTISKMAHA